MLLASPATRYAPYLRVLLLFAAVGLVCAGDNATQQLTQEFDSAANDWFTLLRTWGFRICAILCALFTLGAMIFTEHRSKILIGAVVFFVTAAALRATIDTF